MASNTFPLPKVVSTLQQSRLDYNEALTSVLTNFASPVPPNSTNIQLVDSTGLQTGMMYYKSGSNVALGQGLLYIYNGSSFVRDGIATYRVGSTNIANAAIVAGYLKSGDLIISDAQPDRLFMVNASNTYVIDTGIPPGGYTATNADMLDGLDSSQFVRRDVAQTIPAAMTFVAPVVVNNAQSNVKTSASIWTGINGAIGFNSLGRLHWDTSRIALWNGAYFRDGSLRYMYTGNGFASIDTETAGKDGVIRLRVGPKGTAESAVVVGTNIELSNTGIALNGDVSAGRVSVLEANVESTAAYLNLRDTNGVVGGSSEAGIKLIASGTEIGYIGSFSSVNGTMIYTNNYGNLVFRADAVSSQADSGIYFQIDGATRYSAHSNAWFIVNGNISAITASVSNVYTNNGGALAPGYTFANDLNTGMYLKSDDNIGFSTGGVERLSISNSGVTLGSITVSGISIPDYIVHTSDIDSYFGFPSNGTFSITLGGSSKFNATTTQTISYNPFIVYNNNATFVLQDTESTAGSNVTAYILMRDGSSTVQGQLGFAANSNLLLRNYNGPIHVRTDTASPIQFLLEGVEKARFDANGSLSANSISASYIDVRGASGFRGATDSAGTPSFSWSNDLNTGMFWLGADTIGFSTGGVEKLRIRNDGRVGIGTSNPSRLLEVSGPSTSYIRVNDTNGVLGGTVNAGIELTSNGATSAQVGHFGSVNSTLLLSNQTGNVVIRADQNNIQADSSIFLQIDGVTKSYLNAGGDWFANSYSVQGVESVNNPSFSWSYEPGLGMYRSASNTVAFASGGSTLFSISPAMTYVAKGNLATASGYVRANSFYAIDSYYWENSPGVEIRNPTANTLSFVTSGTESVQIDSYGRVGIGTSTPSALLHVRGTTAYAYLDDSDGAPLGSINSSVVFTADSTIVGSVGYRGTNVGQLALDNLEGNVTINSGNVSSSRVQITANSAIVAQFNSNLTTRMTGAVSAANFEPYFSNGFRHRADSANLPGFTWVGNRNTGMYSPATNEIGFSTGGVKRVGISSSGLEVSGVITGTAVTQTSVDKTSNRLVKTGDFGLGNAIILTASDNLNSLTASGMYYNPLSANTPGNNYPLSSPGSLFVVYIDTTLSTQTFVTYGGPSPSVANLRMFVRSLGAGPAWTPWAEVLMQDNILGTVSMSSGEPTGAIIERSSNANGEYVKFADGTLICTKSTVPASRAINLAIVGGFRDSGETWVFPATFAGAPSVQGTTAQLTASSVVTSSTSNTACSVFFVATTRNAATALSAHLVAIGRWI